MDKVAGVFPDLLEKSLRVFRLGHDRRSVGIGLGHAADGISLEPDGQQTKLHRLEERFARFGVVVGGPRPEHRHHRAFDTVDPNADGVVEGRGIRVGDPAAFEVTRQGHFTAGLESDRGIEIPAEPRSTPGEDMKQLMAQQPPQDRRITPEHLGREHDRLAARVGGAPLLVTTGLHEEDALGEADTELREPDIEPPHRLGDPAAVTVAPFENAPRCEGPMLGAADGARRLETGLPVKRAHAPCEVIFDAEDVAPLRDRREHQVAPLAERQRLRGRRHRRKREQEGRDDRDQDAWENGERRPTHQTTPPEKRGDSPQDGRA